jgi:hypothetical protein
MLFSGQRRTYAKFARNFHSLYGHARIGRRAQVN